MTVQHVTSHAVSRYLERVDPQATYDQVIARLDTPRIREMIAFGASAIVLPTGHHAPVVEGKIVTVLSKPGKSRKGWESDDE